MAEQHLLYLTISKVDGPVFEGDVISVTLPGVEGEMTILPHHEPFITNLRHGTVSIRTPEKVEKIDIESGTLEVSNNQATVLL